MIREFNKEAGETVLVPRDVYRGRTPCRVFRDVGSGAWFRWHCRRGQGPPRSVHLDDPVDFFYAGREFLYVKAIVRNRGDRSLNRCDGQTRRTLGWKRNADRCSQRSAVPSMALRGFLPRSFPVFVIGLDLCNDKVIELLGFRGPVFLGRGLQIAQHLGRRG